MRTAITIGFTHEGEVELLTGTEVSNAQQREILRHAPAQHERFARVEVWESDRGMTRSRKFGRPGPSENKRQAEQTGTDPEPSAPEGKPEPEQQEPTAAAQGESGPNGAVEPTAPAESTGKAKGRAKGK